MTRSLRDVNSASPNKSNIYFPKMKYYFHIASELRKRISFTFKLHPYLQEKNKLYFLFQTHTSMNALSRRIFF